MKWVITKAFAAPDAEFGPMQREVFGDPAIGQGSVELAEADTLPFRFRLLNGDGTLDYEGRSDDCDSVEAFDPLDWAMSYAGSTEIHYQQENGEWQLL